MSDGMLQIHALGPLSVDGLATRRRLALVAGEKRLALFLYLLLNGRGGVIRRDLLLPLLWPEADEGHARSALRSLVREVRSAVGDGVVVNEGDHALGVDVTKVRCDVLEFEAARKAGEWERAVELYRGRLLDGFGVSGAAGFEEWLEGERARLATQALDACRALATEARARGAHDTAVRALRKALTISPYDERVVRELMDAMVGAGHRAGALLAYEQFAAKLQSELEVEPGAETVAVAAGVKEPRAIVQQPSVSGPNQTEASAPQAAVPSRSRYKVKNAVFVGATVVLVFAVALLVIPVPYGFSTAGSLDSTLYAIMPFDGTTGLDDRVKLIQHVQDALGWWNGVSVADPLRDKLPLDAVSDEESAVVARDVGAGRYVRGSVNVIGESLFIRGAIYRTRDRARLADHSVRLGTDARDLDSSISELIDRLLLQEAHPDSVSARHGTRSLAARRSFAAGERAIRRWNLPMADSAFGRAVTLDPEYGRAQLWLAISRAWGEGLQAQWSLAAQRAEIDTAELSPTERALVDALLFQSRKQLDSACLGWQDATKASPDFFAGWYGLARCLVDDNGVIRDAASPSGWRFRTSYQQALQAYERAFVLSPPILGSFRDGSYAGLRFLFKTGGNETRTGRAMAPDSGRFAAVPEWRGDTLAFVPYPRDAITSLTARRTPERAEAVHRLRLRFRDVALAWVSSAPGSADGMEALSIGLWLLGDPAALDTLQRAHRLSASGPRSLRLSATEVWMQLAFAVPTEVERVRRVRRIADSLLAAHPPEHAVEPLTLASLAALTGRAVLAGRYMRDTRIGAELFVLEPLRSTAPALLVFAALSGPMDTLDALERLLEQRIDQAVLPTDQRGAREAWLMRAATLAYPVHRLQAIEKYAGGGDYLLNIQASWMQRDTGAVVRGFDAIRAARSHIPAASLTFDALFPEAALLAAMGEHRAAAGWLDPPLAELSNRAPSVLARPERAASLVQAMALRAQLAAELGDQVVARQWANVVSILWSGADAHLQSLVRRMTAMLE